MSLSVKQSGAWKECQSLHVKVDGEWKEISELFSKKDGAWVTVFSSGALIEFYNYPYPIPVMAGWQKSTDGSTWTNIEEDGRISAGFTGFIKTKGDLVLNTFVNAEVGANIPVTEGSTYMLNGESGVADLSKILTFNNSVTGTIKYKTGDLVPSMQVIVMDTDGNIIEGADISFEQPSEPLVWDGSSAIDKFGNMYNGIPIAFNSNSNSTYSNIRIYYHRQSSEGYGVCILNISNVPGYDWNTNNVPTSADWTPVIKGTAHGSGSLVLKTVTPASTKVNVTRTSTSSGYVHSFSVSSGRTYILQKAGATKRIIFEKSLGLSNKEVSTSSSYSLPRPTVSGKTFSHWTVIGLNGSTAETTVSSLTSANLKALSDPICPIAHFTEG